MSNINEDFITNLNIYQICRICLSKHDDMKSISSPIDIDLQLENNVNTLLDLLNKVTNVQVLRY